MRGGKSENNPHRAATATAQPEHTQIRMKNFLMSPHYNFKFVAQIIIKVLCAEQHTRPQTCKHTDTHTQTYIECGTQMPQSFQSLTHTQRVTIAKSHSQCYSLPVTDTQTCRYIQKYIAAQPSFLSVIVIEFFIPCAHQVLAAGRGGSVAAGQVKV